MPTPLPSPTPTDKRQIVAVIYDDQWNWGYVAVPNNDIEKYKREGGKADFFAYDPYGWATDAPV